MVVSENRNETICFHAVFSPETSFLFFDARCSDGSPVGHASLANACASVSSRAHPETIDHVSFHLDGMPALREALETLKKNGVELKIRATRSAPHRRDRRARRMWVRGFTIRTVSLGALGSERCPNANHAG